MLGKENLSETNENMYNDRLQKGESLVIPVIEEKATIDKQLVETGRIRIQKQIEEVNETANIDLQHDEYNITRIAVNKYIDEGAPQVRNEGDTLIIPVVKEVIVKRLLLVEEIHIKKGTATTSEQVNMPLRKEVVSITRVKSPE